MSNPRDLFLQLLAEALWIERMLAFEVIPQLRQEADSEWLAKPLDEHLAQTREHVARVEQVFLELGAEPTGAISPALEGLRREHDQTIGTLAEPRLRDLFLTGAIAKSEHLELAHYSSLIGLAPALDVDSSPLQANVREEEDALRAAEEAATKLRKRLPS